LQQHSRNDHLGAKGAIEAGFATELSDHPTEMAADQGKAVQVLNEKRIRVVSLVERKSAKQLLNGQSAYGSNTLDPSSAVGFDPYLTVRETGPDSATIIPENQQASALHGFIV
jgi:hypothetical protein